MKLFLTFPELQDCIKKAKEHNACSDELSNLKDLISIEEFFEHPKCAFWLCWYADNILHRRWTEAEDYLKSDPWWFEMYQIDVI